VSNSRERNEINSQDIDPVLNFETIGQRSKSRRKDSLEMVDMVKEMNEKN